MSTAKPLIAAERRSILATFASLYRGDEGFRFLTDLALIGGLVFAILALPFTERASSNSPSEPVEQLRSVEEGFPDYTAVLATRKSNPPPLAQVAREFQTDLSNFDSSTPVVRVALVKAAELENSRDIAGARVLLAPLDLNDRNVAYMTAVVLIAAPDPKAQRVALELLAEAASKGQRQASTVLGMASMMGFGGAAVDKEAGRAHLEQAANAGDVFAARLLGWSLNNGWFGTVDIPMAARYTLQAADGGSVQAMVEVAGLYFSGRGLPRDSLRALEYALKAADAGSAEGQLFSGFLYLLQYGVGTQKTPAEAVRYLKLALAQNQIEAAFVLGGIYTSTAKEPEWHDPVAGAQHFRRCANALHAKCLFAYAASLELGAGVPQDLIQSFAYYALAEAGGMTRSTARLKELGTRLTADDQRRAIRIAHALVAAYVANPPLAFFSQIPL